MNKNRANEISGGRQNQKDELWKLLLARQGEEFHTVKGLPFTYTVKGGELFVSRKKKSITRATIEQAYRKILDDSGRRIKGPKALNCFGAPYIWAIFRELGIIPPAESGQKLSKNSEIS